MSESLATVEHNGYTPEQIALVKRTVAKDATNDELNLYLHDCHRRGVHPLDRLLHFTIRTDKRGVRRYTPITSIDLFRSRAGATDEHVGTDDAVYVTEEGTKFPQSASVTVYRLKGTIRCPFTATARWSEYKPASEDFMWVKMPYTMLGKCAEALALRKAFPQELGGLYTSDEMEQAAPDPDLPPGKPPRVRDLTPDQLDVNDKIVADFDEALADIEQNSDDPDDLNALIPKYEEIANHADHVIRLAAPRIWRSIAALAKLRGWVQDRRAKKYVAAAAAAAAAV